MNARLDAIPLATARLEREKVELAIERSKLEARKAAVVRVADAVGDGLALRRLLAERFAALEAELCADLAPGEDEWRAHAILTDAVQRFLHGVADAVAAGGAGHQKALAAGLRPRRTLTVSEWADAKRVLKTGTANPGPWHTSLVPYLREIMDGLSAHSPVRRVVFMKSAQVGGTEAAINWLGYVIEHAPAEMLMVMPTLELMDRFVKRRLNRLIEETDAVASVVKGNTKRDASNSLGLKVFAGGSLIMAGANSPNSLRSDAVRYTICDEVDGFEWEVGQEGDPLSLIENRMRTYARRKLFMVSTPTIKGYSRIEQEYQRSDMRRYHVPCPHCGEPQHLKWKNLKWKTALPSARAVPGVTERKLVTAVWYECEHCGASIEEFHKPAMLAGGRWIAEAPDAKARGYHINALYSPIGMGLRWPELAQKWLDVQGDLGELKTFVNTYLGETWEDPTRKKTDARELATRAEPYKLRTVPPGCLRITVGIDVQDNRLAVQYLGHGRGKKWWVLDWLELPGDPGRDQLWHDLAALLETPLRNTFGIDMLPAAAAIDIGGHHADDVKAFTISGKLRFAVMAVKGASRRLHAVLPRRPEKKEFTHRGRTIKRGAEVWEVGTEHAKDRCYNDLAGDRELATDERRAHFSDELDDQYFDQLTSEVYNPVKNRYECKKGRRNEALDTWVYAWAAAHHPLLRIDKMRDPDWERLALALEPPPAAKVSGGDAPAAPGQAARPAPAADHGFGRDGWSL